MSCNGFPVFEIPSVQSRTTGTNAGSQFPSVTTSCGARACGFIMCGSGRVGGSGSAGPGPALGPWLWVQEQCMNLQGMFCLSPHPSPPRSFLLLAQSSGSVNHHLLILQQHWDPSPPALGAVPMLILPFHCWGSRRPFQAHWVQWSVLGCCAGGTLPSTGLGLLVSFSNRYN